MVADLLKTVYSEAATTALDLLPILLVIAVFQFGIIRRRIVGLSRIVVGLLYLTLGLTLFRVGVVESLIPVGRDMARQLVDAAFASGAGHLADFLPILAFATAIGFTATMIEPTLIATAERVQTLSGGSFRAWRMRVVVATGFALGLFLGTLRILYGLPLAYLLLAVAGLLIVLALSAPREIVPIALDSGGVATSVVTVPLIAAYGLTVAEAMPNDATAADGFGLIILALLMPVVLLLAIAQVQARIAGRGSRGGSDAV